MRIFSRCICLILHAHYNYIGNGFIKLVQTLADFNHQTQIQSSYISQLSFSFTSMQRIIKVRFSEFYKHCLTERISFKSDCLEIMLRKVSLTRKKNTADQNRMFAMFNQLMVSWILGDLKERRKTSMNHRQLFFCQVSESSA